jgi:hypothetical protein
MAPGGRDVTTQTRKKTFTFNQDQARLPVVVDLAGTEIQCRPVLDGLTLMQFTEAVSLVSGLEEQVAAGLLSDQEAAQAGMAAASSFLVLLRAVVVAEEWPKFENAVKEQGIQLDSLAEIAGWLVEQYSDRPTPPS